MKDKFKTTSSIVQKVLKALLLDEMVEDQKSASKPKEVKKVKENSDKKQPESKVKTGGESEI